MVTLSKFEYLNLIMGILYHKRNIPYLGSIKFHSENLDSGDTFEIIMGKRLKDTNTVKMVRN